MNSLLLCIPFAGLLLCIAVMPLVKPEWWEELQALAEFCGERTECSYCWEIQTSCGQWKQAGG